MDFIDWRNSPDKQKPDAEAPKPRPNKFYGKAYMDYIDEQIRAAEERGEFANLPGAGKPLQLEQNVYAGDKAAGYNLLKSNRYAPPEIELLKEIRAEREHAEAKIARVIHHSRTLHHRRVPPFASEKRVFNATVEKTASEYERTLRELNRKILTLNLITPSIMHQPMLEVERLVQQFREACPLFEDV
jgi:DnaJ family protein C protein 28